MTREDIIARLCALVSTVSEVRFHNIYPHDCFCGNIEYPKDYFKVDEMIIKYIEDTILEKLENNS